MVATTYLTSNVVETISYMGLLDEVLGTLEERVDWNGEIEGMLYQRRDDLAKGVERDYWHAAYRMMQFVVDDAGTGHVADRMDQDIAIMITMEHVSGKLRSATGSVRRSM
ncbi:uncharacterized protein ATNIH1004_000127 [Aspergillus tanneri]|nr:uncharacterized protein ATNIH1004_000127 [Aspergillus tanneri]KAA8651249.1 hypothetical protein ATNIH1004_000127 [Aspergillus tanneri]